MNMNVFYKNEQKMSNASSTEIRKELVQAVKMPGKLAKQIVAVAMKYGSYCNGGLRVVVINHPKHHGRKAA